MLEVSIADGDAPAWTPVRRAIDERLFPTRAMLEQVLATHAYKWVGRSPDQVGDPLPRCVLHVRHRRPVLLALFSIGFHLPFKGAAGDDWREAVGVMELRLGAADGCISDAVRLRGVIASYEERR